MNIADVLTRLQDLPDTYRRQGGPFPAWESSLADGLARFTTASDAVLAQASLANAKGPWLDVWGNLLNIPRQANELDDAYRARIPEMLLAWRGTVPGIEAFMGFAEAMPNAAVTEPYINATPPVAGWSVTVGAGGNGTNYTQVCEDLKWVRPCGVPFTLQVARSGCVLSTIGFMSRGRVTGSYLVNPTRVYLPDNAPSTTNKLPTLPMTYLTDPTLNPAS